MSSHEGIRTTARAWAASSVTLLVSSAGLFAVSATSTTTSTARMAVAAAVLSALSSLAGLLVTDVAGRTLPRRVLWGGTVPIVWALGTAALVAATADLGPALLAGLPWLLGAAPVVALGARLPVLRGLGLRATLGRLRGRVRSAALPDER
ncbi:hypothetical protein [uncultured Friedmanniella sp.]|uniref:hypothetical protein n=1 Tax=uncultured Friedmanniella sp. TaxID=335381 RepID=UPI0035CA08E4